MPFADLPDDQHLLPRLAAGLRVVPRGRHHLQVGLYDERRVVLPRTGDVEHTLTLLLRGSPVSEDPTTRAVLAQLADHACLTWEPRAPATRPTVAVFGSAAIPGLPDLATLLAGSAVEVTTDADADVVVVLGTGELDRERLDPLVRSRTSHVVVRLVDGGAVLGPFVVPGTSPCLRCIDAHLSLRDPDHTAVTTRYARATGRARPDGVPDLDHSLALVALAWVARDVLAHLAGQQPSTWSRTLHLGATPARPSEHLWLRHPLCGCCWSALADPPASEEEHPSRPGTGHAPARARTNRARPSGTMEA